MLIETMATEESRFLFTTAHHIRLGVEKRKTVIAETKDSSPANGVQKHCFCTPYYNLMLTCSE
jgi:hypothetical protein